MRTVKGLLVTVALVTIIFVVSFVETHYTMYATVSERVGNIVVLTNVNDDDFIYELDTKDAKLEEHSIVKLTMNNNHTEHTTIDDTIEYIKVVK